MADEEKRPRHDIAEGVRSKVQTGATVQDDIGDLEIDLEAWGEEHGYV